MFDPVQSDARIIPTFSAGNTTYTDVIVKALNIDYLWAGNPVPKNKYNGFAYEAYMNAEFGLIAFFDVKTNSLFYIEQ